MNWISKIKSYCKEATAGPWKSMRSGNQYLGATKYLPTAKCVGTSRVEGLERPWNPYAMIGFMKLDNAEESRFKDADADFISNARTDLPIAIEIIEKLSTILKERIPKDYQKHPANCSYWKSNHINDTIKDNPRPGDEEVEILSCDCWVAEASGLLDKINKG